MRKLALTALATASLLAGAPAASADPVRDHADRLVFCLFFYDGDTVGFVRCLAGV